MKRSVNSIIGFAIGATDGEIGKVKEFYFDDQSWTVRYLVVETGNWLSSRKVLIPPSAVTSANWDDDILNVSLSKDQVKNSPNIDTNQPVSRQQESELYSYYDWDFYWAGGLGTTGMMLPGYGPMTDEVHRRTKPEAEAMNDVHLRSTHIVDGYNIGATDGEIGDVEDFIVDDTNWQVSFMIVDTGNWLPGKKVLISPRWIKNIDWDTSSVFVNLTKEEVKNSPEYDSDAPLTDTYENELHEHYHHVGTL